MKHFFLYSQHLKAHIQALSWSTPALRHFLIVVNFLCCTLGAIFVQMLTPLSARGARGSVFSGCASHAVVFVRYTVCHWPTLKEWCTMQKHSMSFSIYRQDFDYRANNHKSQGDSGSLWIFISLLLAWVIANQNLTFSLSVSFSVAPFHVIRSSLNTLIWKTCLYFLILLKFLSWQFCLLVSSVLNGVLLLLIKH